MRVPTTVCLRKLHQVPIGHFLIDSKGHLGIAAMWGGEAVSFSSCCYVPLSGPEAFTTVWSHSRFEDRAPLVAYVGPCEARLSFDTLLPADYGFEREGFSVVRTGDLVVFEKGAALCIKQDTKDMFVHLSNGELDEPSGRHVMRSRKWSLIGMNGQEEIFSVAFADT